QSENLSQRLMHTENRVAMPADPYVLADGAIDGLVREQVRNDVRTDYAHITAGRAFALSPKTAGVDRDAIDFKHRRRRDAANLDRVNFLIATLGRLNRVDRHAGSPAGSTYAGAGLGVFLRHRFAAVVLDEVFARRDYLRAL